MASKNPLSSAVDKATQNLKTATQRASDFFLDAIDALRGKNSYERKLFLKTYDAVGNELRKTPSSFNVYARKEQNNLTSNITPQHIGRLMLFAYDPKYKEELPYYDRLPLILLISMDSKGFLGLNLHYIPPKLRAILLDQIIDNEIKHKYMTNRRITFNYRILQRAARSKLYVPCIKRYLYSSNHVKSRFLIIPPEQWNEVLFLPFERFAKASTRTVHLESMRKIRKYST